MTRKIQNHYKIYNAHKQTNKLIYFLLIKEVLIGTCRWQSTHSIARRDIISSVLRQHVQFFSRYTWFLLLSVSVFPVYSWQKHRYGNYGPIL